MPAPGAPAGYETSGPFAGQPAIPYPPQPAYGMPAAQKNNGLAIAGFVCSMVGIFCGFPAVLGIIFGFVSRGQIKKSGGAQKGEGLALAAIIVGFVFLALWVILVIVAIATGHCTSGNGTSTCTAN